jgi:DNA-directed RNA polymerase specialized sigma24 family protein
VTDDESVPPGETVLDDLFREGFLVGLMRQLRRNYPTVGSLEIEDAVCEAAAKVLEQLSNNQKVNDVRSYFAKVAYRTLTRSAARAAKREAPLEEYRPTGEAPSAEHEVMRREEEAWRRRAIEAMKREVRSWTENIREVMLVIIEAAEVGEPIETDEIARIVGQNVGREVSVANVRSWKQRGFRRLREFLEEQMEDFVRHTALVGARRDVDRKGNQ